MADTVTTNVNSNTGLRYEVVLTGISDGTGETDVQKIDISSITLPNRSDLSPESLALEKVEATVNGFSYIRLYWERTAGNNTMVILPQGETNLCLKEKLIDPGHGAAGTGDVYLTSVGAASGDSYVIRLRFKVKYS
jgi:hypothetical protein